MHFPAPLAPRSSQKQIFAIEMWTEMMCVTSRPGSLSHLKEENHPLPRNILMGLSQGKTSFDCVQCLKLEGIFMMASFTMHLLLQPYSVVRSEWVCHAKHKCGHWLNITEDRALSPIEWASWDVDPLPLLTLPEGAGFLLSWIFISGKSSSYRKRDIRLLGLSRSVLSKNIFFNCWEYRRKKSFAQQCNLSPPWAQTLHSGAWKSRALPRI